jgi:hypothetical protein
VRAGAVVRPAGPQWTDTERQLSAFENGNSARSKKKRS